MKKLIVLALALLAFGTTSCAQPDHNGPRIEGRYPELSYTVHLRFAGHQWGPPGMQLTETDDDRRATDWHGARLEDGSVFGLYNSRDQLLVGLDVGGCYEWAITRRSSTVDHIIAVWPSDQCSEQELP